MLTLLGMDVLLLQMKKDIELSEDLKNLSQTITIGEYVNWELEKYDELVGNKAVHENSKVSEEGVEKNLEAMTADKEKVVVHIPERKRKSRNIQEKIVVSEELLRQKVDVKRSTERATRERKELSYEQLAQLASSVVMIAIHDETGEVIGTGSGIMIGRGGFILTNFHVIRGGAYFSIRMEDEEKIYRTDEVIKYHSDLDLAILRIDRILTPIPVYEGKEKLVRGQRVVAIGSPLGLFNSVSDGIISGFRTTEKAQMIQFTAPTSPGSSGGALLNLYGEVIGISTAGIDGGQNINLAVPYESILPFIRGFS
ncbi:MAG: serine protease [Clostridium sp.]|nr:serine protease [Clostridium sp.]